MSKRLQRTTIIAIILIALAGILRIYIDRTSVYDYEAYLRGNPERLFAANFHAEYDITGMYADATVVALNISDNRFISPEPDIAPGVRRILFLGGSTTEALYVSENERWVALLGGYNAGTSASNTLDKLRSLQYLQARGLTFDQIVIMTAYNDAATTTHIGAAYTPDDYDEAFITWRVAHPWATADTVLLALQSLAGEGSGTLADCRGYAEFLDLYSEQVATLLGLLKEAAGDTPILVMSEASSFDAPSASFVHDLRITVPCDDVPLSYAESAQFMRDINTRYLAAASALGLDTFDLASAISPFTNGAEGGHYMYDHVHMTVEGSRLVAETLRALLYGA
jgi:hypothetical protein